LNRAQGNVGLVVTLLTAVYFLVAAFNNLNEVSKAYEESQAFDGGSAALATVLAERSRNRIVELQFKDAKGRQHSAKAYVYQSQSLRIGQKLEISYRPDEPHWVRVPSKGLSDADHHFWRVFFFVWVVAAICVIPRAIWLRFHTPDLLRLSKSDTVFVLKKDYFRTAFLAGIYAFGLFFVYAFPAITIEYVLPVSLSIKKGLLIAWFMLMVVAVGRPALRFILNPPLVLSKNGLSIYGREVIYWTEVSQIMIKTGGRASERDMNWRLIIPLKRNATSKGYRTWQIPLRKLRPVVYLNLYSTRWDIQDLVTALNHFGVEDRDPEAAARLRATWEESGLIKEVVESVISASNTEAINDSSYYMSAGFHTSGKARAGKN